jgi:Raf kinase inhibitor-like YbhB/YbcL family protein
MAREARPAGLLAVAVPLAGLLTACGGGQPAPAATPDPGGSAAETLTVTSNAFAAGAPIPAAFTCRGGGQAPALAWTGDARGATAFAVYVDDPDAPGGGFVHWVVLDLPGTATRLDPQPPAGTRQGRNSAGGVGWTPPCPPSGTHHYRFTVYALKTPTGLPDGAPATDALAAIQARAAARGQLVGTVSSG